MHAPSWTVAAMALAMSVGCVPKKKYDALEKQYSALQAKQKEKDKQLKHCHEAMKRRDEAAQHRLQRLRDMMRDLKPLIDSGVLTVDVRGGRVKLDLRSDILFASGSAELSDQGKATLSRVTKLLAHRTDEVYQVEGHTDSSPISSEAYPDNWYLGAARAINVVEFMIANGMPANRISAATYAATEPVASNRTDEGRARNRRIEITVVPDLRDLPGYNRLLKEVSGRHAPPPPRGHPAVKHPK